MKLNHKGQGLIEYLIIVALMAVASIGILRLLNQNVQAKFANIIYALQGSNKRAKAESITDKDIEKRDLGDFMNGAASKRE